MQLLEPCHACQQKREVSSVKNMVVKIIGQHFHANSFNLKFHLPGYLRTYLERCLILDIFDGSLLYLHDVQIKRMYRLVSKHGWKSLAKAIGIVNKEI